MTNKPKSIGTRFESACVKIFKAGGIEARRIPLAGARDNGDLEIILKDLVLVIECKNYKNWSRGDVELWRKQAIREAKNYAEANKCNTAPVLIVSQYGKSLANSYVHMFNNGTWQQVYLDEFVEPLKRPVCQ